MQASKITFHFKEIFPDYESWKRRMSVIVDYTVPEKANFDLYIYNNIYAMYANSNVRYQTKEEFIRTLIVVYTNKFMQFFKQKELIDNLYNLTPEDLIEVGEAISNMTVNPNEEQVNIKKALDYITTQNYSVSKRNKFEAYLNALQNMPTLNIFKFLNDREGVGLSIQDLFMSSNPNTLYLYGGSNNEC